MPALGPWAQANPAWSRPKLADALEISLEELDRMLAEGPPVEVVVASDAAHEPADDPEHSSSVGGAGRSASDHDRRAADDGRRRR